MWDNKRFKLWRNRVWFESLNSFHLFSKLRCKLRWEVQLLKEIAWNIDFIFFSYLSSFDPISGKFKGMLSWQWNELKIIARNRNDYFLQPWLVMVMILYRHSSSQLPKDCSELFWKINWTSIFFYPIVSSEFSRNLHGVN